MLDAGLKLSVAQGIASIRFDRPEQRNAFNSNMITALGEALDQLADTPDCRLIVLRGSGGHFCAGWDFHELTRMQAQGEGALRDQFAANLAVLDELERHPKVVICLLEGSAMGFGFSLVARSDVVLATDSCQLALPEIALGIVPAIVMLDVQQAVTPKFAVDWLLSGRRLGAEEALRAGLVSRVFPAGEFDTAVEAALQQIVGYSPTVLSQTKALFAQLARSRGEGAQLAIDTAIAALNSPAAQEGLAALQEKRKPRWPE